MGKGWSDARKAVYADMIRRRRPWEKSTGPKSEAGKAKVRMNAYKGGTWKIIAALREFVNDEFAIASQVLQSSGVPVESNDWKSVPPK